MCSSDLTDVDPDAAVHHDEEGVAIVALAHDDLIGCEHHLVGLDGNRPKHVARRAAEEIEVAQQSHPLDRQQPRGIAQGRHWLAAARSSLTSYGRNHSDRNTSAGIAIIARSCSAKTNALRSAPRTTPVTPMGSQG